MNFLKRKPTTPGEILNEEYLKPLRMTQRQIAHHIGCDIKVINRLINGKTNLTAEMALKLAASFKTSPEFWMNAQKALDLYDASRAVKKLPLPIMRLSKVAVAWFPNFTVKINAEIVVG